MSQAVFSLSATSKPELLLAALLPDIRDAVSRACYHYSSDQSEIEDVCHQMIILLMEDDYHRLRSFRLESSIKTWLTAVALHYVSNYVGRQKRAISLDDISRGAAFVCAPAQEAELISEEMRCELNVAVAQLTAREQQLLELLCRDDLTFADVAMKMGIKVESVHRRKYALIKKLRGLVNSTPDRWAARLKK